MSTTSSFSFSRASEHSLSYSGSSSTSPSSVFSEENLDVDEQGFLQSVNRAGGPYICSLPATTQPIGANYRARIELLQASFQIKQHVSSVLTNNGVEYTDVSIVGRLSKVDPEPWPIPTILVLAKQQSSFPNWRSICTHLYRYISTLFSGISVEIITEELDQPFRCFPISPVDTIFAKWDNIRCAILRESNIWDWTSLECWRFGTNSNPEQNAVTIIVSVQKSTNRGFQTDRARIWRILARYGESDTAILFMKDQPKYHAGGREKPLAEDECTQHAQPGGSISIRGSPAGSSTLGGFIEIRHAHSTQWRRYAITCFHSVYPPEGQRGALIFIPGATEAFNKWELCPVTQEDPMAEKLLQLDHPSVHDINGAIKYEVDNATQEQQTESYRALKRKMRPRDEGSDEVFVTPREESSFHLMSKLIEMYEQSHNFFQTFLDKNRSYLGEVFAGSGMFRTRQQPFMGGGTFPCVIDWALIDVTRGRMGINRPRNIMPGGLARAGLNDLLPRRGLVEPCYKSGKKTKLTQGMHVEIAQARIARKYNEMGYLQTKVTHEYMVTGLDGPFAEPGDSGALVFDERGNVLGLLIGGFERKDNAYVTHIQTVFDDIKEVTGAVDVRIVL